MQRVLITGCSSGIGRALADAFKAAGYEVWASARKPEDVALLAAAGFNAVQLDVNDKGALAQLAEHLDGDDAGLDVLINNAGYGAMGPLLDGGVEGMQLPITASARQYSCPGTDHLPRLTCSACRAAPWPIRICRP